MLKSEYSNFSVPVTLNVTALGQSGDSPGTAQHISLSDKEVLSFKEVGDYWARLGKNSCSIEIHHGTFIDFTNLKELYIRWTKITSIHENSFESLKSLEKLQLGYSFTMEKSKLDINLDSQTKLRELSVSGFNITDLNKMLKSPDLTLV